MKLIVPFLFSILFLIFQHSISLVSVIHIHSCNAFTTITSTTSSRCTKYLDCHHQPRIRFTRIQNQIENHDVDVDVDVDVDNNREVISNQSNENEQYYSPNNIQTHAKKIMDSQSTEDMESSTSMNEYSFFDEANIYVRAGSGGQGASTYRKAGPTFQDGVPDGGNGGNGGNVILMVDENLNTLAGLNLFAWKPNRFGGSGAAASATSRGNKNGVERTMSFRADNGSDGENQYKNGRYGKDVYIRVPPGTIVQEEIEEIDPKNESHETITKLVSIGSVGLNDANDEEAFDENGLPHNVNQLIVASGGDGGEGSGMQGFKKGRGVKRTRASPTGGERKRLILTLKIVADVALVGVPNAGKSTFLAAVTRAKPKIANYPFTTVIPNLGVWIPPNEYSGANGAGSEGLALCDVPGLIAGAAGGVGLGHAFLRHVERCHVILHLVDATSSDPIADFHMVNNEITQYGNGKLAQMPQIVVVNKVDAWEEGSGESWEKGLKTRMDRSTLESELKEAMTHSRLMWMSAKEKDGVDDLMGRMAAFVKKVKSVSS